jgi:DNA-binding NarL/FixJ family response regulator
VARSDGITTDPVPKLNDREQQCLEGIAAGLNYRQIGSKLFLSESTVKNYLRVVYTKLNARSQSHAVSIAYQMRLL